jgi:hypothetical protein
MDFSGPDKMVTFTSAGFVIPRLTNIRLIDEYDNVEVVEGRLEVLVDGEWGTICNRSWTAELALLACNQVMACFTVILVFKAN